MVTSLKRDNRKSAKAVYKAIVSQCLNIPSLKLQSITSGFNILLQS